MKPKAAVKSLNAKRLQIASRDASIAHPSSVGNSLARSSSVSFAIMAVHSGWRCFTEFPMRRVMNRQTHAPSLADIDALARLAISRLPDVFRQHLGDVVLRVEDFPDADVCRDMALTSEFDILGLYAGHAVGRSVDVSGSLPDTIYLYRRPILDVWSESGESLEHLVTHVLVHEVGHHFGLSDEDIDRIEASVAE